MLEINFFIVTIMKFLELLVIFGVGFGVMASAIAFRSSRDEFVAENPGLCGEDGSKCFSDWGVYIFITLVLWWYHVMHNNLMVNLRLAATKNNAFTYMCCWKNFNYCICKLGMGHKMNGC